MIVLLDKSNSGDQINKKEMGETCSKGRKEKYRGFSGETCKKETTWKI
jgi:hypothetical protein